MGTALIEGHRCLIIHHFYHHFIILHIMIQKNTVTAGNSGFLTK